MNTDTVPIRQAPIISATTLRLVGPRPVRSCKTIGVDEVVRAVGSVFGIPRKRFFSRHRSAPLAFARQVAMALAYEFGCHSQREIGGRFRRDHANVHYAIGHVRARTETEPRMRELVEKIKAHLRG